MILLELLLTLLVEIVWQVAFEIITGLGALKVPPRDRPVSRIRLDLVHLALGVVAGVVSLLIVGRRLVAPSAFPGLSLVLSPLGTGLAMHLLGELWGDRRQRPALFTFRGGCVFAFGMALVRFAYFELGWLAGG